MKRIYLSLVVSGVIAAGSIRADPVTNAYYDRMNAWAEKAKANPKNKTALHQLEELTASTEFWTRYYAYVFLFQLAIEDVGGYRAEIVPYFDKALEDPDPAIRREAAEAILEIGAVAVDREMSLLLKIVDKSEEDDITWFSTEALGKLGNQEKAREALPVLLAAANKAPPAGTQVEAPQVRYYALDSIGQIAKRHGVNPIPQLEKIMDSNESPYKDRVAKVILELEPTNKKAQQVLHSGHD